jgi:uncharacterized membrane protein HdeD (DUF308 family)
MREIVVEHRRTGWDIALGILLVIAGLVVLGNAAVATTVSMLFIGWLTLAAGVITLLGALLRVGGDGFWLTAICGGLLSVLGLVIVRNPSVAALTLTLVAGAFFLAGGVVRLAVAFGRQEYRWPLLLSGIVSTALGLIVLFNLVDASYALLGILLGIELLIDGLTIMLIGRIHVTERSVA